MRACSISDATHLYISLSGVVGWQTHWRLPLTHCTRLRRLSIDVALDDSKYTFAFDGDPQGMDGQAGRALATVLQALPASVTTLRLRLTVAGDNEEETHTELTRVDWSTTGRHLSKVSSLHSVNILLVSNNSSYRPPWPAHTRELVARSLGSSLMMQGQHKL